MRNYIYLIAIGLILCLYWGCEPVPEPQSQVSAPQFNPPSGTYNEDIDIIITCSTPDANIYYTLDGSSPSQESSEYSVPISVSGNNTTIMVRVFAQKSGMIDSKIQSATYNIQYKVAAPVFDPPSGVYNDDQEISITCSTSDANIYYTTDGSEPTQDSPEYTGPISISGNNTSMTLRAIAVKIDMIESEIEDALYNIKYKVSTPVFNPTNGAFTSDQNVEISCATIGASIIYTLDGSIPTSSNGEIYTDTISITNPSNKTIKAMAYLTDWIDSDVGSSNYIISPYILDGVTYTVDGNELIVSDCDLSKTGNIVIPEEINGLSVTTIGYSAFEDCSLLAGITLPDSIDNLSSHAFENCSGLTSMIVPSKVTIISNSTFKGCSGLTSITLPSGITEFFAWAFMGCSSLTTITLPSDLTAFQGGGEFKYCTGLLSITIPSGVKTIGGSTFAGCSNLQTVNLPSNLEYIHYYAFQDCTKLKNITIPAGVKQINEFAFKGCSSLTSLTLPNSITVLGLNAFQDCIELTSITLPTGITTISNFTFNNCAKLSSITLPSNVTSIGESAFENCTGLTNITLTEGLKSIGISAFRNCSNTNLTEISFPSSITSISNYAFFGCDGLTNVILPDGLTVLGDALFAYCSHLTTVILPSELKSISYSLFRDCSGLISVIIPPDVTSIGNSAFRGCTNLFNIIIPTEVTSIEAYAFRDCTNLSSIFIEAPIAPTVGTSAFLNVTGTVYVFSGSTGYGTIWNGLTVIEIF